MWTALTKPERLRRWLAEAEFEERVGGRAELRFGAGAIEGTVRALDRSRLLEYEWIELGTRSVVRFQLEPADGTLLVLDHRLLPADAAAGFGAGWHSHLDSLAEALAAPEGAHDPDAWWGRFRSLLPRYGEAVAGAGASDRRTA
ncbi:MAG: SRPBCC domain-containing protein [Actinomycetota bacterium]|nr:SRPBCC domain-containing protein [Actinomycetota bacterium]